MCAARIVVNEWLTTTTYDKPKDVDADDAANAQDKASQR